MEIFIIVRNDYSYDSWAGQRGLRKPEARTTRWQPVRAPGAMEAQDGVVSADQS